MTPNLLLLVASIALVFWGGMHIAKTRPVVAGFEPLTDDNRYVLTMEWLVEGVALIFAAVLVAAVTLFPGPEAAGSTVVYRLSVAFLLTMAVVSLFTGAKASLMPYKLCASIFGSAAVLIFLGGFVL